MENSLPSDISIPETATQMLVDFNNNLTQEDQALVKKSCLIAYQVAIKTNLSQADMTLMQGLHIAEELLSLQCDVQTLSAAICYPSFKAAKHLKEWLEEQLGTTVVKLLIGTQRMEAIDALEIRTKEISQQNQADNLRKMLLAVVDDIRIVLIKLAERLVRLRSLKTEPTELQKSIAQQVINLYAPLANRLGVGQLKWQLEDWAFRYNHPQSYQEISKALKMRRKDRENYITKIISDLQSLLSEANIHPVKISGRPKHIYSIFRKIQKKQIDFQKIYDASAVRILVPTVEDCYAVLSIVHNTWEHIPQEFDDYIAKPKPNGYQSIHTAVIGPDDIIFEIQIRTFAMHDTSELGVAAHWKYKESEKASVENLYEQKINWLRELMDWQRELAQENPKDTELYTKIFKDRIYLFTPQNDVLDMPTGATPLDFAYQIHTQLGHRCRGAKVNGQIVPLTHTLKTGDKVEVITGKEAHPSRDWLNLNLGYLKTNQAKNKVAQWFRHLHYQEHLLQGHEIWEKTQRRYHFDRNALKKLADIFNFQDENRLLSELGSGKIGINTLIHRLLPLHSPEEHSVSPEQFHPASTSSSTSSNSAGVSIQGIGDLLSQLARCCQPIPGDNIVGYITRGRGITIHQRNCHNIQAIIKTRPQRIIQVNWDRAALTQFIAELLIEAEDRSGLIRDISNIIASEHVPIMKLNSHVNALQNSCLIQLTVQVKQLENLKHLMQLLSNISSVKEVRRKTIN